MPAPQSAKSHTRWDPLFHFFALPVLLLNVIASILYAYRHPRPLTFWLVVVAAAIVVMALKTRLYPLGVQDRVIRLEERLRMMSLCTPAQQALIAKLDDKQFVGLRFASDAELAGLVERAVNEKLDRKQIKQAIQNWRADYSRI